MPTRFENGIVVTLGKNNRVIWNGSVVTDGETIAAVGEAAELKKRYPDAEAVDCAGKIVLPGFICAHHHFYSTMARGMAIPGEPASNFVEILERLWWKVDKAIEGEDITLSAQIPLIECIRNGTTTIIDHHASPSMRDGSLDLIEAAVRGGWSACLAVLRSFGPQPTWRRYQGERTLHQEGRPGRRSDCGHDGLARLVHSV
jgi:cytosine/adenosine deaminase-related metal-dependent hydrolase